MSAHQANSPPWTRIFELYCGPRRAGSEPPSKVGWANFRPRSFSRERVARHLNGASIIAAYTANDRLVTALQLASPTDLDAATADWLYEMLASRYFNVVRVLAEALRSHAAHIELRHGNAGAVVAERLAKSIVCNEDPQTVGALMNLLIPLEKRGALEDGIGAAVVENLRHAVNERLPMSTPQSRRQHLPALFGLYKQALVALAFPHYGAAEVDQLVRALLTEIDVAEIAGRSQRTMPTYELSPRSDRHSIVPTLEELWPTVSDGNKGAIAECVIHLERHTAGERSKRLARRDDCPVDIQTEYTRGSGSRDRRRCPQSISSDR